MEDNNNDDIDNLLYLFMTQNNVLGTLNEETCKLYSNEEFRRHFRLTGEVGTVHFLISWYKSLNYLIDFCIFLTYLFFVFFN